MNWKWVEKWVEKCLFVFGYVILYLRVYCISFGQKSNNNIIIYLVIDWLVIFDIYKSNNNNTFVKNIYNYCN